MDRLQAQMDGTMQEFDNVKNELCKIEEDIVQKVLNTVWNLRTSVVSQCLVLMHLIMIVH